MRAVPPARKCSTMCIMLKEMGILHDVMPHRTQASTSIFSDRAKMVNVSRLKRIWDSMEEPSTSGSGGPLHQLKEYHRLENGNADLQ